MFTEMRIQMALGKGLMEILRRREQGRGWALEGGNACAGPELRGRDQREGGASGRCEECGAQVRPTQ